MNQQDQEHLDILAAGTCYVHRGYTSLIEVEDELLALAELTFKRKDWHIDISDDVIIHRLKVLHLMFTYIKNNSED